MLASLSPQKLFRRELLDRHGIRFPEGKVRLEDGIMVTRCYLASRRTAVTADYDYYFLHARRRRQHQLRAHESDRVYGFRREDRFAYRARPP